MPKHTPVTLTEGNGLQTFSFGCAVVRTVVIEGEPWFFATDVAKTLGYAEPEKAVRTHCKGVSKTDTPLNGVRQTVNIIREGDVFRLILRSKLPTAQAFEAWVMDEVLPSIRRTGGYGVQAIDPSAIAQAVTAAMGWNPDWKQSPAEKLEQARKDAKGAYELVKTKVLPALERMEAKPPVCLGEVKPKDAIQLLNSIHRVSSNPRAYAAAKRLLPALFVETQPEQQPLPGLEA